MSNFYLKETRCSASAALALFLPGLLSAGEQGKMTREIWSDVPRTSIPAFTASARYWQAATSVSTFPGAASPVDIADNFASRVRAYITAPVTGNYTFWIASDDDSELRLSIDESKFNRVKIAAVEGWVNPQQ